MNIFGFHISRRNEVVELRHKIDQFERGNISTPYMRAIYDQARADAMRQRVEVARLNRVVFRQSAKIKRMRTKVFGPPSVAWPHCIICDALTPGWSVCSNCVNSDSATLTAAGGRRE